MHAYHMRRGFPWPKEGDLGGGMLTASRRFRDGLLFLGRVPVQGGVRLNRSPRRKPGDTGWAADPGVRANWFSSNGADRMSEPGVYTESGTNQRQARRAGSAPATCGRQAGADRMSEPGVYTAHGSGGIDRPWGSLARVPTSASIRRRTSAPRWCSTHSAGGCR